jgi:hypothetical protein
MALNPLSKLRPGNIRWDMYVYMSCPCHGSGVTDDGKIKNTAYGSP